MMTQPTGWVGGGFQGGGGYQGGGGGYGGGYQQGGGGKRVSRCNRTIFIDDMQDTAVEDMAAEATNRAEATSRVADTANSRAAAGVVSDLNYGPGGG